jgi:hypothetical protein
MEEKNPTPEKEAALKELRDALKDTDADTQARRTLAALRLFSLTTFELSRDLGVYHPPASIKELRQAGNTIITLRETVTTKADVKHRLSKYVLLNEAGQEQAA